MGIRSRLGIQVGNRYSVSAILGVIRKEIAQIRLPKLEESISVEMFKSKCLPYEASKTYRMIMCEYNHTCTETVVEARRYLLRGL